LRPRLTAGLPLSAFGPKAAVRSSESDRRRSVVLRCTSSRSQRRPMRCAPSIDTHRTGTRGNLSHIADITRGLRAEPAMNSCPFSEVQAKSRGRLSDLCHMRGLRQFLRLRCDDARAERPKKKEAGFPAPLAMTNVVCIVFFLAAAIRKAALSHKTAGKRAFARNPRRRWCFGSPAFVPRFSGRPVALRPCLAAGVPLRSAVSQAVGTCTPQRN